MTCKGPCVTNRPTQTGSLKSQSRSESYREAGLNHHPDAAGSADAIAALKSLQLLKSSIRLRPECLMFRILVLCRALTEVWLSSVTAIGPLVYSPSPPCLHLN